MRIKSKTDVITNSSDEVYVVRFPGMASKDLKKVLNEIVIAKGLRCSGMGGVIEVLGPDEDPEILEGTAAEGLFGPPWFLPEDYLVVDIDYGYCSCLSKYLENYSMVDTDWIRFKIPFLEKALAEAQRNLENCVSGGKKLEQRYNNYLQALEDLEEAKKYEKEEL